MARRPGPQPVQRWVTLATGVSVVALVATGCSSSKSSGKSSTSASSAANGSSDSSSSSSASGGSASSKSPIMLASAAPLTSSVFQIPQYKAGIDAAVASINAAGGVNGHQLSLSTCDTQYTVNGELACARKILSSKPAAVVAPEIISDQSGAEWKLFASAKLPVIGSNPASPVELNSDNVFPQSGGIVSSFVGQAAAVVAAGVTKITILIDSNPIGAYAAHLMSAALTGAGSKIPVTTVTADASSDPTFATAAAKATAGGVNGVVIAADPTDTAKLVGAVRAGGYTGKISIPYSQLTPQALKTLGKAANGLLVDSTLAFLTDSSNAGITKFNADMKSYGKGAALDNWSLIGWSAVKLFAAGTKSTTSFDPATIMKTFAATSTPINIGTLGPWSVVGKAGKVAGATRIVNPTVTFGTITNGQYTSDGKGFVNPFTLLAK